VASHQPHTPRVRGFANTNRHGVSAARTRVPDKPTNARPSGGLSHQPHPSAMVVCGLPQWTVRNIRGSTRRQIKRCAPLPLMT
jgi:hypothetical protein